MNRRSFMATIGGGVAGAVGLGALKCGYSGVVLKCRQQGFTKIHRAMAHPSMLLCSDGKLRPFSECNHEGRVTYEIKGIKA